MIVHVNSATDSQTIFHTVRETLADLRNSRDLLYQVTRRDIRIRYKQAVMGFGWAIFMPILIVLSGMIVRLAIATLSGGKLDSSALATMAVKSLPWAFYVGTIGFAVTCLTGPNSNLVTKIYFPREVLPLAALAAQAFDTAIGTTAVCIGLPFLGVVPHWSLLWVIPLIAMLLGFTAAAALLLSAANLFFRDVKYIVQVMLTFGIFFTPVLYEPAMLGPIGAKAVMLNPLAPMVEGFRLAIIVGHNLMTPYVTPTLSGPVLAWSPWYLLTSLAWSLGGLAFSIVIFHRAQSRFAEMV